jgi:FlgD Ig-like domain
MFPTRRLASILVLFLLPPVSLRPGAAAAGPAVNVSLTRSAWFWCSPPASDLGEDSLGGTVPPVLVSAHGGIEWYNPHGDRNESCPECPYGVKERDLDPTLSNAEGGDVERTVLELRLTTPHGEARLDPEDWTGVTQALPVAGVDFTPFRSLGIWVNDFTQDHSLTRARLHVDIGLVSEDAFWDPENVPNGALDTEDKNGDGKLDFDEDTGLDGTFSKDEPGYDASTNPDPHHDDYPRPLPADYTGIDNLEGNELGSVRAKPDTEDLNGDRSLDFRNDYFEATIDLADTEFVAVNVARDFANNPDALEPIRSDNGWRLFRLPLTEEVFHPLHFASWEDIRYVRLWINGMNGPRRIQIGGIELLDSLGRGASRAVILSQNAPNPFNPGTTIRYELQVESTVRLRVYDLQGRLIRTFFDGTRPAGRYEAIWNGEDSAGKRVPSGVYWYRLDAGGATRTRQMVLVR